VAVERAAHADPTLDVADTRRAAAPAPLQHQSAAADGAAALAERSVEMILTPEQEIEELVKEVRALAAVHGANTLRVMLSTFAEAAQTVTLIGNRVHGDGGLTEFELRMANKRGIDPAKLAATKAAAIAAGTYPSGS